MRILATIRLLLAKAKQKITHKQRGTQLHDMRLKMQIHRQRRRLRSILPGSRGIRNQFGPDPMCMVGLNRGVNSHNNCTIPCEE